MSPMPNRADLKDSLKIRVLVVDDNEAFLRVATDFLRRHDELTVVGAICGGEEALAQVQDLQPQVILIGLERPGLEILPRLRNILPGVGIIALTLLKGNAYRQAAMAAGADDLVPKAELTTDLLPAIRRVTQANRSP
jgi:two-component system nitrate/nitrite response regulator NarL